MFVVELNLLFLSVCCWYVEDLIKIVKNLGHHLTEKEEFCIIKGKNGVFKYKSIASLTGQGFQDLLVFCFKELDYVVELTPRSYDYGADFILYKNNMKTVVQAKRYKDKVGPAAVQQVKAAVGFYQADYAVVITNSRLTSSAYELAAANGVELWDRDELQQLLMVVHKLGY